MRLAWRTLTGRRCHSRDNVRCVFTRAHDGLHGAPTIYGFGYRWWK